ncbi:reverse transcriptase [Phytophthora megakarya]|uniref:Reverse transcriptase n=1 Tax=Phytophthora megakarya TaxID=4795 RepID=A0A225W4I1_9STRA|nr:reverse transcriptase [Phytophthora megakarya]
MIVMVPPTLEPEESLLMAGFDGSLLCFDLLSTQARGQVVICGDSNLVIRQMRGEIDCNAPGLQPLSQKALNQLRSWPKHEFVHVKRDWNQSADKFASAALQREEGDIVTAEVERQDLITLNRLHEILQPKSTRSVTHVNAITRSVVNRTSPPAAMDESIVRRIRRDEDRDDAVRLVVPESLQQDFLHHYHTSQEGGHEGVWRTYRRIRTRFHWRNLNRSVQRYVGECTDCETGKGKPTDQGRSPGNVQGTYPFQVISMDHIPSLPKSFKGNTDLLIWADLFTGYVIFKAGSSLGAQAVAENYEECVFSNQARSGTGIHDRFFRAFNRIVKMRQSLTMSYHPPCPTAAG